MRRVKFIPSPIYIYIYIYIYICPFCSRLKGLSFFYRQGPKIICKTHIYIGSRVTCKTHRSGSELGIKFLPCYIFPIFTLHKGFLFVYQQRPEVTCKHIDLASELGVKFLLSPICPLYTWSPAPPPPSPPSSPPLYHVS